MLWHYCNRIQCTQEVTNRLKLFKLSHKHQDFIVDGFDFICEFFLCYLINLKKHPMCHVTTSMKCIGYVGSHWVPNKKFAQFELNVFVANLIVDGFRNTSMASVHWLQKIMMMGHK